jgi:hypothetical protein
MTSCLLPQPTFWPTARGVVSESSTPIRQRPRYERGGKRFSHGSVSIFPSSSRKLWHLNLPTLQIYMHGAVSHAVFVHYAHACGIDRRRKTYGTSAVRLLVRCRWRPGIYPLGSNAPSSYQIISYWVFFFPTCSNLFFRLHPTFPSDTRFCSTIRSMYSRRRHVRLCIKGFVHARHSKPSAIFLRGADRVFVTWFDLVITLVV